MPGRGSSIGSKWLRGSAGRTISNGNLVPFIAKKNGATSAILSDWFFGSAEVSGAIAATEAQDSAAITASIVGTGSLAATEVNDAAAISAAIVATSSLAATEANDIAAFDGSAETQNLHGRRIRGKRVVFPDELLPEVTEAPKPEPLPSLETIRAKVAEAKQALKAVKIAQIRAKEREAKEREAKEKALNALSQQHDATLAALRQAEEAERAWIRRLQDEDDFLLLAA